MQRCLFFAQLIGTIMMEPKLKFAVVNFLKSNSVGIVSEAWLVNTNNVSIFNSIYYSLQANFNRRYCNSLLYCLLFM